jgi:hypothetical protein
MPAEKPTSTGPTRAPGALPRAVVFGPGPVFLRWTPASAAEYPEIVDAVAQFDAGQRDPGNRPSAGCASEA